MFVCVDIFKLISVVRENEMPKESSTMVTPNDINSSRFLIALFGLLTCLVAIVQSGEAGKLLDNCFEACCKLNSLDYHEFK